MDGQIRERAGCGVKDRGEWVRRCAERFRQIVVVTWEEAEALAWDCAGDEARERGPDPAGWRDPEEVASEDVRAWCGRRA